MMQFFFEGILTINLILCTFIFFIISKIYLFPKIQTFKFQTIVLPILLLHSFRHLGLMFLSSGATYPGMPLQFAYPAAFGDLLTAVLALVAIPAVIKNLPIGRPLTWIFNIVGTLDLILAIALGTIYKAQFYMGAAYWIPAFWVPALLVTHYICFVVLMRVHNDHAD